MWGRIGQAILIGLISGVVVLVGLPFVLRNAPAPYNGPGPAPFFMKGGEGKWEDATGKKVEGPDIIKSQISSPFMFPDENGQQISAVVVEKLEFEGIEPSLGKDQEYLLIMSPVNVEIPWRGKSISWKLRRVGEDGDPYSGYLFAVPSELVKNRQLDINFVPDQKPQFI